MIVILKREERKKSTFDIENTTWDTQTVVYCEFIDLWKVFVVSWSESESLLSPVRVCKDMKKN